MLLLALLAVLALFEWPLTELVLQTSMNGLESYRLLLLWLLSPLAMFSHSLVLSNVSLSHREQLAQESLVTVLRRAERTLLRTPTPLTGGPLVAELRPPADPPEEGVAQEAGQGQAENTQTRPPEPPETRGNVRLQ